MQASANNRKRSVRARPNAYRKDFDSRKRRVRGLWQRNGKSFDNLNVEDDLGRASWHRVPLRATSLTEVIDDYRSLLTEYHDRVSRGSAGQKGLSRRIRFLESLHDHEIARWAHETVS